MAQDTVWKVPIKGGGVVEVTNADVLAYADQVYVAIVGLGLKDLLNRGMTKIKVRENGKALEGQQAEDAKNAAIAIAQKNLANLKEGKLPRIAGQKASDSKIPGVVMTEARRLARILIKDEIKASGGKISNYSAKTITDAANAYLATDEGKAMLAQAQANVDARTAKTVVPETAEAKAEALASLSAKFGLKVDEDKVAKAASAKEKEKAAGDAVLSKAAAGKVKTRTKAPQPNA